MPEGNMRALIRKAASPILAVGTLIFALDACADETVTLTPPSGSTKESRASDLKQCLAIASEIARLANVVAPFEKIPLRGQSTGRFLFSATLSGPRPYADDNANPTRASTALGINQNGSPISDRYVICLLAKGYHWPDAVPLVSERQPETSLPPEVETKLLYEAGRMYRYRGLPQEGERLLKRVVELDGERLPDAHPYMVQDLGEYAIALLDLKRIEEGLRYVDRLLPAAESSPGNLRKFQAWIFERYAEVVPQDRGPEYKSKLLETARKLRK
jgi:hypothetical protein